MCGFKKLCKNIKKKAIDYYVIAYSIWVWVFWIKYSIHGYHFVKIKHEPKFDNDVNKSSCKFLNFYKIEVIDTLALTTQSCTVISKNIDDLN